MDELLANLNTDAPMFDPPSVLGPSFDMDNGFITDQPDAVPLYAPDMSIRPPPSAPPPAQSAEIDYLAVDEPDIPKHVPAKPADPATAAAAVAAAAAAVATTAVSPPNAPAAPAPFDAPAPAKPHPPPLVPDSPDDSERRRLRPVALALVADSWRASRNPADFVSAVRTRLPSPASSPTEENSDAPAPAPVPAPQPPDAPNIRWQLPAPSEGALLDALFIKLVNGEATSTRLMSYLSYSLVTGIVSQRAVIATCLRWIHATPAISDRVMQSFARLLAHVIPHYRFSPTPEHLTPEITDFLAAFVMILKSTAKSHSLAPDLVAVLTCDRVIALVRACLRRLPAIWPQLDAAIADLDLPALASADPPTALASQSASSVAPQLNDLIPRLKNGLCVGITPLESIASSIGNLAVPSNDASLPVALQTAFAVTLQVFGTDVATALRDLWSQREGREGDFPLLVALERATKATANGNQSHSAAPKYGFKNKVQACEAIVRFLAERSSQPGASEKWKGLWGGKERLKRIIRDAIPQVKNEIRSEAGALIVSMAVTCCAGMCLGPALRMSDANDGVDVLDPVEASQQETQNEEVEETMGELIAFAVSSLEEAATAEETPLWRSFGLWLLLLMSRSGSMLRASGCEHVRAARVLRAWGGMPTGTPGSHTAHGSSSHKHSSQSGSGHQQSQGSSSSWAMTEGVTMFAASASLAIIDVSDVSGSDETIRALCDDLVQ